MSKLKEALNNIDLYWAKDALEEIEKLEKTNNEQQTIIAELKANPVEVEEPEITPIERQANALEAIANGTTTETTAAINALLTGEEA